MLCFNTPRSSENKAYLLDVGSAKIPVYCHMTKHGLDTCGGGGWTLVMKIDGTKVLKVKWFHKFPRLSSPNSQYKGKLTMEVTTPREMKERESITCRFEKF